MTHEVSRYAEAVIVGEAESVWREVLDDARHGTLKSEYRSTQSPLDHIRVDRRVFAGKPSASASMASPSGAAPIIPPMAASRQASRTAR